MDDNYFKAYLESSWRRMGRFSSTRSAPFIKTFPIPRLGFAGNLVEVSPKLGSVITFGFFGVWSTFFDGFLLVNG